MVNLLTFAQRLYFILKYVNFHNKSLFFFVSFLAFFSLYWINERISELLFGPQKDLHLAIKDETTSVQASRS